MKSEVPLAQWEVGGRLRRSTRFRTVVVICQGRWQSATGLLITWRYGSVVNDRKVADIRKTWMVHSVFKVEVMISVIFWKEFCCLHPPSSHLWFCLSFQFKQSIRLITSGNTVWVVHYPSLTLCSTEYIKEEMKIWWCFVKGISLDVTDFVRNIICWLWKGCQHIEHPH